MDEKYTDKEKEKYICILSVSVKSSLSNEYSGFLKIKICVVKYVECLMFRLRSSGITIFSQLRINDLEESIIGK